MTISAYNTSELANQGKFLLLGLSRGVVCYGASITFNQKSFTTRIAKRTFPTGIVHFILLNAARQPLNERLTFINHHDHLKIDIHTINNAFKSRDSIPVQISVKDASGNPVIGSFSMAVTDDNQVKTDEIKSDNTLSYCLLSSELKGYVENPNYYLEETSDSWKALDALLLTQGWVGYDISKINQPIPKPIFEPEYDFAVKGTVTNLFNKPVSEAKVMLLSKGDQNFFKDTTTNKEGKFTFSQFPKISKSTFVISARNSRGRVVNGGISVDERNLEPVTSGTPIHLQPWNVNTDTTLLNYVKLNKDYHEILDKTLLGSTGRLLRAVSIKDKAIIKGSKNLNGPGSADQTLSEQVMVNAGRASLLDVLLSKVSDFHSTFHKAAAKPVRGLNRYDAGGGTTGATNAALEYFIKDKRVHFMFDGVDLDKFYEPFSEKANDHYEFQKQYLDYVSAEDVLGVEVIYKDNGFYNSTTLGSADDIVDADATGPRGSDFAYIEITTRAGNGPFIKRANGIYIYKPLPITEYKQFYEPHYRVKDAPINTADLRSTIYWEPNIVTDKNGHATVAFYAADRATKYTIMVEGADLKGGLGYHAQTISIMTGNKNISVPK